MPRRQAHVPLNVFLNNRHVGILDKQSSGAIAFVYAAAWLAWEHAFPVSLSLPLRTERYIGAPVVAVFENLLPDALPVRTRLAERVGASGTDAYSMLAQIGRDCVGALQFLPDGAAVPETGDVAGEDVDEAQVEALLNNLARAPLGLDREQDFRISVAGAQEKTALLRLGDRWLKPSGTTPTTHLLKPQIGQIHAAGGMIDLSNSVENEHYCLTLLAGFGLPVARTAIHRFGETRTLVVERFDRRWTRDGRLLRLPQEDFCQALSVPPAAKYQNEGGPGVTALLDLLQGSDDPAPDRLVVFKAQLLFWLIGAPDGHAKNFSLFLKPGGRFSLTPLYDVLTGQPGVDARQIRLNSFKLAMSVGTSRHYRMRDISGRHFFETGREAGLSEPVVREAVEDIRVRGGAAFSSAIDAMPEGFPEQIHASVRAAFEARIRTFDAVPTA